MILLPAIDLKNRKAVRLIQGDFKQETIYSDDPLSLATAFETSGAKYLHMVDLNGAEDGMMVHEDIIKSILKETNLLIEIGGGIRSLERVERLLSLGVNEVIIGSIAVLNPTLLEDIVSKFPNRIIVSIDAKDGFVLTKGWQETSSKEVLTFAKWLEKIGIKKIVYTDVSKDGMLDGPSFDDYASLLKETNLKIIASGGVSSMDDLIKLNEMGLYGAIIGKALYEKKIDLKEALRCLQKGSSLV